MTNYRVYVWEKGRITSRHDIDCHTDEEAKARALTMRGKNASVEVWKGAKLVAAEVAGPKWPVNEQN